MTRMDDREVRPDPRAAFTSALVELRNRLPDLSDEVLARRASAAALPSGRRVTVNARRVGEWLSGRSVPRDFEQVLAFVHAAQAATGGTTAGLAPGLSVERWRGLWRAAHEHRGVVQRPAAAEPAADLVVGRPPSDAASLRERPVLAGAVDAGLSDETVQQVVLTGPGGSGKSQLAAAAFHRARGAGGVYVWVPASSRQSILGMYARTWRAIAGPASHGTERHDGYGHDEETQADLLVAWLRSTDRPWRVVLDDVDDPAQLDGLWPIGPAGRSIVTTRHRGAMVLRPSARVVSVGMFTPAESVAYLRGRLSALDDDGELAALAGALGHLPLALGQAAAYLIDTGTPVAEYRRLLDDRRERLADLFPPSSPADGHDRTVAGTWRLAAQRAATLAKPGTAQRMLELIAVFVADGVPEAVLLGPAAQDWVGGTRRDALLALRALHRLNLVDHNGSTVAMHALVQRAVLEAVPDEAPARIGRAAADALEETWESADLYANAEALRRRAGEHLWRDGMHPVFRRLAEHLARLGRAAAARELVGELLDQARARLGAGHRDVVFLRVLLARTTGDLGDPSAAYAALSDLRREAERLLDPADPDLLTVRLHQARQRYEGGGVQSALDDLAALAEDAAAALGAAHPVTLSAREHLALCHGLSGDPAGARDRFAALALEQTGRLGEQHLDTLNVLSYLGRWVGETGDTDGAVQTYERAVAGLDAVVGPLHHDTLTARHNLAYWRALAGQLAPAVDAFTVAAADAERALGPRHPTTLTFRVNLAYWRGRSGDPARGLVEIAELRHLVESVLGPAHPRALRVRQQHAELRHRCGDTAGAVDELTETLARMREVQGDDHPRTREAAELLTRLRVDAAG